MPHILVPVDFSADSLSAAHKAVTMAQALGANMTLVHVHRTRTLANLFGNNHPTLSDDEIDKSLHALVSSLDLNGTQVDVQVKHGTVSREVSKLAEERQTTLIVMGTHGTSGKEPQFAGSNAYRVVITAQCPVLTMRGGDTDLKIKRIVLPLDTTAETREKIPFTLHLAKIFGAEIHVLGVVMDSGNELVKRVTSYTAQVARRLAEEGIPYEADIIEASNITTSTIEYATKVEADLISIMTEQERSMMNNFLGPYVQQMINHSPIAVLSMHHNQRLDGNFSVM